MVAKPGLAVAMPQTEPKPKPRREKVFNEKSTPGRRGKRAITYFLLPETLEDLKEIAEEISVEEDRDVLLKDVIQRALNLMLQSRGRKATA